MVIKLRMMTRRKQKNDDVKTKNNESKLSLGILMIIATKRTVFSTRERKKPEYLDAYEREYDYYFVVYQK